MIGPFMKVYGSKWSAAKAGRYPAPTHSTIFEPFAGGAGYSCAHHEKFVELREAHPELSELWRWLIQVADEATIRDIPILEPGTDILSLDLSRGQSLLVKWWQRTNNHGTKTWTVSPWGNKPGQWTESTRSRVAEQVGAIKHWRVVRFMPTPSVTVFCDPSYQFNYQYGAPPIDYAMLGADLIKRESMGCQVIACEAVGKNGETPNYLPFRPSHIQVTSRRKQTQSHHSRELVYYTGQLEAE
jgi:hypothetical protein